MNLINSELIIKIIVSFKITLLLYCKISFIFFIYCIFQIHIEEMI